MAKMDFSLLGGLVRRDQTIREAEDSFDIDGQKVFHTKPKILAKGAFGRVCSAEADDWEISGSRLPRRIQLAIKHVDISFQNPEERQQKLEERFEIFERILNQKLNHKHLVRFYAAKKTLENSSTGCPEIRIFMEFCSGGTLEEKLKARPLSNRQIRIYAKQILEGLDYLHRNGVVHTDIKPRNIMIANFEDKEVLKIADYDDPVKLEEQLTRSGDISHLRGTDRYLSPEMAGKSKFTDNWEKPGRKTDIWSFGCVVLEMALGYRKFKMRKSDGTVVPISDEKTDLTTIRLINNGARPDVPSDILLELQYFIEKCLKDDPKERWSAEILLRDLFLSPLPEFRCQLVIESELLFLQSGMVSVEEFSRMLKVTDLHPSGSENGKDMELTKTLEKIDSLGVENALILVLKKDSIPEIPERVRRQVAVLNFLDCNSWSSECLKLTSLPNLVQISFSGCQNLKFFKGHWGGLQNVRALLLHNCRISHAKENFLADLTQLVHVQLPEESLQTIPKWLEEYQKANPWLCSSAEFKRLFRTASALQRQFLEGNSIGSETTSSEWFPVLDGPVSRYYLQDKLERGSFGKVFVAVTDSWSTDTELDESHLVVRILDQRIRRHSEQYFQRLKEISSLSHVNLLRYYGCSKVLDHPMCSIAMEYIQGGTLKLLIDGGALPDDDVIKYSRQLLCGIRFLHSREIIHTALQPDCIYVYSDSQKSESRLVIAGLDEPTVVRSETGWTAVKDLCDHDTLYMSPELSDIFNADSRSSVDTRTDIWSFGSIFIEMIRGYVDSTVAAFTYSKYLSDLKKKLSTTNKFPNITEAPIPVQQRFLSKILQPQDMRWDAERLLRHPYLSVLPKMKMGSFSEKELIGMTTENCAIQESTANGLLELRASTDGLIHFELYIRDMERILQKLAKLNQNRGLTVFVYQETNLKELFQHVQNEVILLVFQNICDWDSRVLKDVQLPNVLEISFVQCEDITIHRGHMNGIPNIRAITFWDSTVLQIENNVFEEMHALRHVGLNLQSAAAKETNWAPMLNRLHLRRLYVSAEFEWMRKYFSENPELVKDKNQNDVWTVGKSCNFAYREEHLTLPEDKWQKFEEHWMSLPTLQVQPFSLDELKQFFQAKLPSFTMSIGNEQDTYSLKLESKGTVFKIPKTPDWYLHLQTSSETADMEMLFSALTLLDPNYPLFVGLFGVNQYLECCLLKWPAISQRIVQLTVSYIDDFSCERLRGLPLPNLLRLDFFNCLKLSIKKSDLNEFKNVRAIVMMNSTIAFIEENVFLNFPHLQFVDLDFMLIDPELQKHNQKLLRESEDYKWLRDYLKTNPTLVQSKAFGELYRFKGRLITAISSPLTSSDAFSSVSDR